MKKEEIEEIRIQQEAEIARKIEQEVQKRADELERVMENERREQIDAQLRADQLEKSVIMTQEVVHHFRETLRTEKELREVCGIIFISGCSWLSIRKGFFYYFVFFIIWSN